MTDSRHTESGEGTINPSERQVSWWQSYTPEQKERSFLHYTNSSSDSSFKLDPHGINEKDSERLFYKSNCRNRNIRVIQREFYEPEKDVDKFFSNAKLRIRYNDSTGEPQRYSLDRVGEQDRFLSQQKISIYMNRTEAQEPMMWENDRFPFLYMVDSGQGFRIIYGEGETLSKISIEETATLSKEFEFQVRQNLETLMEKKPVIQGDFVAVYDNDSGQLVVSRKVSEDEQKEVLRVPLKLDRAKIISELFPDKIFKDPEDAYSASVGDDKSWRYGDVLKACDIEVHPLTKEMMKQIEEMKTMKLNE